MNIRILIVDDEQEIREMLSRHFRFLGYEADTACHGADALEKMAVQPFQIIISDIMMPVMSGIELLRTLREEYPMVHVIVITGYVSLDNALSCMRLGADTCIFKPLEDLDVLELAVSNAVDALHNWHDILRTLRAMKPDN